MLVLAADIADARNDRHVALATLEQAIALGNAAGLTRLLAEVYARASGDSPQERRHRKGRALRRTSGWIHTSERRCLGGSQRLKALAELQVARGRYAEADRVYERAEAFLDAMIGNASTVLEKTAVITASSQIYSRHFALIAEHFNDPQRLTPSSNKFGGV